MVAQARAEAPLECCGLLAGTVGPDGTGLAEMRYPLVNAAASPVEYLSEPQSMFDAWHDWRARGLDVVAVYHSHPAAPPVPSGKDLALNYDPGVINLIVSLAAGEPEVRGWWLTAEDFREATWEVCESGPAGLGR
jgi:proteasome lid subunit RPN8/RPN11